jgi:alanyl-tRNA synthetase
LNDLAVINMQRKEKIEENRQLIKKLEKQRETIQKAHDESKSRRDQVQRRLEESRATAEKSVVHRLLIGHAKRMREIRTEMDGDEGNEIIGIKRPSNPSLTMCKMLGHVRSPYDGIL